MLRTHMTVHERQLMSQGERRFLLAGDVYRRDEIDSSHMPVFHQVEGVRIFTPDELLTMSREQPHRFEISDDLANAIASQGFQTEHDPQLVKIVIADLYHTLNGLLQSCFGGEAAIRWQETAFPFTSPSFEVEVQHGERWLEVLGSGILKHAIVTGLEGDLQADKCQNNLGWAFGLGLERIAMVLYGIPDIRLFWSTDPRFSSQFSPLSSSPSLTEPLPVPSKFIPFSKYPPITRDLSFYLTDNDFQANDLFEIIRGVAPDLVETVVLVPIFKLEIDYRPNL